MRIDQPRSLMIVIALLLSGCAGQTAPARATASPSPALTATTTAEAVSATRPPSVPAIPSATSTSTASAGPAATAPASAITATPVYTPTPTPPPNPSATPAFAATATATATAIPAPTPAPAGPVRHSSITASTFEQGITVPVGTTVIWTNREGVSHTVTSEDLSIDSPFMSGGERFAHTFTRPGRYELWCRQHQGMTATLVVS